MIEFDRRVAADIGRRLETSGSRVADRLDAVQAAMVNGWSDAHPNLRALGLDYLSSTAVSEMHTVAAGITEIARQIFQRGIDSGELKPTMSAELLAGLYITSVRIGVYHAMSARQPEATRQVLDLFMTGLLAGR